MNEREDGQGRGNNKTEYLKSVTCNVRWMCLGLISFIELEFEMFYMQLMISLSTKYAHFKRFEL